MARIGSSQERGCEFKFLILPFPFVNGVEWGKVVFGWDACANTRNRLGLSDFLRGKLMERLLEEEAKSKTQ